MILSLIKHYTAKKIKFPLGISSINVTKSAGSCGFCHIYWRNSLWKTSFSKENCHLRLFAKLSDPSTSTKTYWSIIKTSANGRKVLSTPLSLVNGKFDTELLEKSNNFNDFFSQQWQPISNDSILSLIAFYHMDNRLSDINFSYEKILTQYLDRNNAHDHGGVSVRLLT